MSRKTISREFPKEREALARLSTVHLMGKAIGQTRLVQRPGRPEGPKVD